MSSVTAPSSVKEALGMLQSAMSYLAAADATAMAAETQAQCLQALEQANSMGTAARAWILGAFTSGQGYSADAEYSSRAWLNHPQDPGHKRRRCRIYRVGPPRRCAPRGRGRAGGG